MPSWSPRRRNGSGPGWCRWAGTRGAWYTAEWVNRLLFPANGPSADGIIPELQHLAVGDLVLLIWGAALLVRAMRGWWRLLTNVISFLNTAIAASARG